MDYPATPFVTSDFDTRVDPMHARKMTAALQAATSSSNPTILRCGTEAGHSGRPRSTQLSTN
jgi:prolyl oligopeptidase